MGESLGNFKRTDMCGDLRVGDIGRIVTVMGWVQTNRNKGSIIFCDLRDRSGILQIVFRDEVSGEALEKAKNLRREFCIAVKGEVVRRESANSNIPTGELEINALELKILSESDTPPIEVKVGLDASETVRMKYRYLDLRRPDMHQIMKVRSQAAHSVREYFNSAGFLEVETPILTKSTPEGARDYLVPSRNYPGYFYALPQSPQLFKQLLMVSETVISDCRVSDEDFTTVSRNSPRSTRNELVTGRYVAVNEGRSSRTFDYDADPFKRITWRKPDKYGSDKPDLRFGMEIQI